MKIDGIDPTRGSIPKPAASRNVSDYSFGKLLDGLVSGAEKNNAIPARGMLPGAGVPFIPPPITGSEYLSPINAVDGVENLLTDLDMFRNALSNKDIPLDRLSSLVSGLADRKDDLARRIGKIDDEQLKAILSNALELVIGLVNEYKAGYTA